MHEYPDPKNLASASVWETVPSSRFEVYPRNQNKSHDIAILQIHKPYDISTYPCIPQNEKLTFAGENSTGLLIGRLHTKVGQWHNMYDLHIIN